MRFAPISSLLNRVFAAFSMLFRSEAVETFMRAFALLLSAILSTSDVCSHGEGIVLVHADCLHVIGDCDM